MVWAKHSYQALLFPKLEFSKFYDIVEWRCMFCNIERPKVPTRIHKDGAFALPGHHGMRQAQWQSFSFNLIFREGCSRGIHLPPIYF